LLPGSDHADYWYSQVVNLGIGQPNALARRKKADVEMRVMNVSYLLPLCFINYANHSSQAVPLVTGRLNAPRSNGDGDQYLTKSLKGHINQSLDTLLSNYTIVQDVDCSS
jgi:hypothetical protein